MEKLLALLNKYDSNWGFTDYGTLFNSMNEGISGTEDLQVISKKFGFIQRLVENDKIERLSFAQSGLLGKYTDFELSYDTPREDYTNMLLMELSIQDKPIEYLISVLR